MNLRILHKGLLLIFVPLLIQLLFFAQLFNLINQAERLEHEVENRMMATRLMDRIVLEYGATWSALICTLFGSTHNKVDPEAYKARMDDLFVQIKPLALPDTRMVLSDIQRNVHANYELLKEAQAVLTTESAQSESLALRMVPLRAKYIRIYEQGLAIKQISEHEADRLEELWQRTERQRIGLKTQIFIGVVADFTITALLLIAFLLNITNRLKVLVTNASLLPSDKVLTNRVSGSDELAMLDSVLHNASTELHSAKEYRKSLMEMVAHDLRSPLTTATSTVEMLLDRNVSMEVSGTHLRRLSRSLNQLIAFVEDLLTIDRLESGKLELEVAPFRIDTVIDHCFDSLSVRASTRGIKLVKEGENIEVIADQSRITQVVMNLLTNAIKHAPDGSKVTVLSKVGKDMVKISVIDQGKGIPQSDQGVLFQKFVQRNDANRAAGFGLGLAICKLIVDAHKGRVGIVSVPDKGSEFWFTLPNDKHDDEDQPE